MFSPGPAAAFGFRFGLDFGLPSPFPALLLQQPRLDLPGCTRMQEGFDQLTQVGIQVGNCAVTISGPLPEVVPLLNHLQAFGPEAGAPCHSRPYSGPKASVPCPASPPAARTFPVAPRSPLRFPSATQEPDRTLSPTRSRASVPVAQDPLQGPRAPAAAAVSRADLAASLPPCPQQWLDRAGSLTASANLDGRERVLRAWTAGSWARLVLQGSVGTPAASRQLNIPSRYYAVIGGENTHPALYRSFKDYSRALGPIEASSAVSHAFPTELETQVYCAAAGVQWPLPAGPLA